MYYGLANAAVEGSNGGNLLGWIIVYAPWLLILVITIRWANRRNRLMREQLMRIEGKIDTLLHQK